MPIFWFKCIFLTYYFYLNFDLVALLRLKSSDMYFFQLVIICLVCGPLASKRAPRFLFVLFGLNVHTLWRACVRWWATHAAMWRCWKLPRTGKGWKGTRCNVPANATFISTESRVDRFRLHGSTRVEIIWLVITFFPKKFVFSKYKFVLFPFYSHEKLYMNEKTNPNWRRTTN